jgi:hypothetical protein
MEYLILGNIFNKYITVLNYYVIPQNISLSLYDTTDNIRITN